MDSEIATLGRRAMAGDASWFDEKNNMRSLSNLQVLAYFNIPPCQIGARIRRLKCYQRMAEYPLSNIQVLACLFGTAKFETSCTYNEATGQLTEHSNPWALRYFDDMLFLCREHEEAKWLHAHLLSDALCVLNDFPEEFASIDIDSMRGKFVQLGKSYINKHDGVGEQIFTCGHMTEEGKVCDVQCKSLVQLLRNHMRTCHGFRDLSASFVFSNRCPNCKTTYSERIGAMRHLRRSIANGFCKANLTSTLAMHVPPHALQCNFCAFVASSPEEYEQLVLSHLPRSLPLKTKASSSLLANGRRSLWRGGRLGPSREGTCSSFLDGSGKGQQHHLIGEKKTPDGVMEVAQELVDKESDAKEDTPGKGQMALMRKLVCVPSVMALSHSEELKVRSVAYRTFKIPATSIVAAAMVAVGAAYNAQTQELKK